MTVHKGQIISKRFLYGRGFFKKTNENTSHISKNEFIRLFFGRIHGLTISFRNFLIQSIEDYSRKGYIDNEESSLKVFFAVSACIKFNPDGFQLASSLLKVCALMTLLYEAYVKVFRP